jgi:cephalosporin hydroxylase
VSTLDHYTKLFNLSLREWLIRHQREIVCEVCRYKGIPTFKNPLDMWIYAEIIHEVRPEVIIEIGSAYGGSTLFFADMSDALVLSVDWDRTNWKAKHDRIVEITGDSGVEETRKKVEELCREKRVLILHDGPHDKASVLRDLRNYSDLVSVGSYFIIEDGIVDLFGVDETIGMGEDGPLEAIKEFLQEDKRFLVDSGRERYILTYSPCGFLKRME